ncbi:MAG: ribonuclease HII [Candidatus Micrarchaeota archaeon]
MPKFVIGVDEAGRGPVIGPLVMCAFAIGKEKEAELKQIGVKDSKLLEGGLRERIAKKISHHPHVIVEVSAEEITQYMRKKISLNEMEAEKVAVAAKELANKVDAIERIYVDSPDPVPKKFEMRIRKYLHGTKLEKVAITSENKADYKYLCVGAASILAKSMRERRVHELAGKFGDFGSGYPSDGHTMEFLQKHFKDPELQKYIRHNWATMKNLKTTEMKLKDFF